MSTNPHTPAAVERGGARFLAWLATLVAAAEVLSALLLPLDPGRHEVDRLAREAAAGALMGDVVLLADSVTHATLSPATARRHGIADMASNQEIGAVGNAFLLERLLAARPGPLRAVVYVASPLSLEEDLDPSRYLTPYFTSVFLRADEIADVERRLARPEVVREMRAQRRSLAWRFPSSLRAGFVLHPLDVLLRRARSEVEPAGGGMPELDAAARRKIDELAGRRELDVSPVTEAYLTRLAELASGAGAVLVLAPPPLAPAIRAAWRANGLLERYEAYLTDFAASRPGVIFEPPGPYQPEDDRLFVDGVHLTPRGKLEWERSLVSWLDGVGRR